ncbi:bacterial Ig-like domain, group 2 [Leptospira sp. B5-022]|nr:bacterial Ig-like domain, group 2 [Leptospira sp. B5-022]MCR1795417.1 Ig-like domain-containing protein [Leptospira sp. id769339]
MFVRVRSILPRISGYVLFGVFLFQSCTIWPSLTALAGMQAGGGSGMNPFLFLLFGKGSLERIEIYSPSGSFAKTSTLSLKATAIYTFGEREDITEKANWSSSDPSILSFGGIVPGQVLGAEMGRARVRIGFKNFTSEMELEVTRAPVTSITITCQNQNTDLAIGVVRQCSVTGIFADGTSQDLTGDPGLAVTSGNGSILRVLHNPNNDPDTIDITGIRAGNTQLRANYRGISASITVNVVDTSLVSIQITPVDPPIGQTSGNGLPKGRNMQYIATGSFADGSFQDITTIVSWSSDDTSIADINDTSGSKGLLTAISSGNTTIRVSAPPNLAGGTVITGSAIVYISAAVLDRVEIYASGQNPLPSVAKGRTAQLTAIGVYSDTSTQNITNSATWSSSVTSVATVDNAGTIGLAHAADIGSTTITAQYSGVSGTASFTVTAAVLESIQVTPTNPNVAKGLTRQFTATGSFSDGTTQDLTSTVTWTSSVTSVATINNTNSGKGLANALSLGTTTITATSGSFSGNTVLTVSAAALVSIQITYNSVNPITIPKGINPQLTATGTYTDGSTQNITDSASWSSSNTSVALVDNSGSKGLVTSMAVGQTTIESVLGSITGTATLTVNAAQLISISVTPEEWILISGEKYSYRAIGTYTDGVREITGLVLWEIILANGTSGNATVSNDPSTKGVVTAVFNTTQGYPLTARASLDGIFGNTTFTIISDTERPILLRAQYIDSTHIQIEYSKVMYANTQAGAPYRYKLVKSSAITSMEDSNQVRCSDNTNYTASYPSPDSIAISSLSPATTNSRVFIMTLGTALTAGTEYTVIADKASLSASSGALTCPNTADFVAAEQIKLKSASCANLNQVILGFSKSYLGGVDALGSALCSSPTECAKRYKLNTASLGEIQSAVALDGTSCGGAAADPNKVCLSHSNIQSGSQYSLIAANGVNGDGFDNSSWGSIRDSGNGENIQSSPFDRVNFLGCGSAPINFDDGPLLFDPYGSTFGNLVDYKGRIYSGPNNAGNAALRFNYDGSNPELIGFSLPRDSVASPGGVGIQANDSWTSTNTANTGNGVIKTLGHAGCTPNSADRALGCGPDNESGRGIFAVGSLGSDSFLFAAGAKTQLIAGQYYFGDYVYYTLDSDNTLNFKYTDWANITGGITAAPSSMLTLNNRLLVGWAKRNWDGSTANDSPDFGFISFNSADTDTGYCIAGNNCDANTVAIKGKRTYINYLPYFGGTANGVALNSSPNWGHYLDVDSVFTFNNLIYAANGGGPAIGHNGSIIRSTSPDPTTPCSAPDTCANWLEVGPRTNQYWHNVESPTDNPSNNWFSLELYKFFDLIPGDKAFPAFAEFNGKLYVARNVCLADAGTITGFRTTPFSGTNGCTGGTDDSNRRAQIWVCSPALTGAADSCESGDWSLIANNGSGNVDFGDPTNRTISMLIKNGSYLYVGFDNPGGIRIYRTNSTNPNSANVWSKIGANGLGDPSNVQQIFSAISVFTFGSDFVYISTGKDGVPIRVYRQHN